MCKFILLFLPLVAFSMGHAQTPETLLIAPGDLLRVQVVDTPEMTEEVRVTDQGEIPVVGVGNVSVFGLTPAAAATAVQESLKKHRYLNHPQATIYVEQYATQNVSVLGEVKASGAYPIGTSRPVLDVLALAGGLDIRADRHILIERGGDKAHPVSYFVSNDGREALASQVMVYPGDTVVVPRAGIVYMLGDVSRPGGYVMSNNEGQLTLLQGVALAGGLTKSAKQGAAHLLRKRPEGGYGDTKFSLGDIQSGKKPDMALQPSDVVYVPFSYGRNIATNASGIVASAAGASIYAIP